MNDESNDVVNEYVLTNSRHPEIIENNITKYDDLIIADDQVDDRVRAAIRKAFRIAHETLTAEKRARSNIRQLPATTTTIRANVEGLYNRGYFVCNLPSNLTSQLQDWFRNDIDELKRKAALQTDEINYAYPCIPEANHALQDFCHRSGVYDSLSAFYGKVYDSFGFVLHHSSPKESWCRSFDDIGMPPAKTLAFHFDAAFSTPKAMVYLNDVGKENGAFSIVPRERPFENIEFDLAFGRAFLKELYEVAKDEFGWVVSGKEGSVFRCTSMRELFATLPHSLRRTSHMGDHLMDNSTLSDEILSKEIVLDGPAGKFPVFMGSHALHRGGYVEAGERIALQIVFFPQKQSEVTVASQSSWVRFRAALKARSRFTG
jgi:hypothetical protein